MNEIYHLPIFIRILKNICIMRIQEDPKSKHLRFFC